MRSLKYHSLALLPPAAVAGLIQGIAVLLAYMAWLQAGDILIAALANPAMLLLTMALLQGAIAAALSRLMGLKPWWIPIQLLFLPLVIGMLALDIAPSIYLSSFIVLALCFGSVFRTQVPLYLSGKKVYRVVAELLPARPVSAIDLGSGLGGLMLYLRSVRPDSSYHGIESALLPFAISKILARLSKHSDCHFSLGDLWSVNLGQFDVVYAYLSPVPMPELWQKARKEMRPGSLFISNTFPVPGFAAHRVIDVPDSRSKLYVWCM